MKWCWRAGFLLLSSAGLSACAMVPQSAEQGVIEIKNVTAAIECELAAVAMDPRFRDRQLTKWKSLTDLDLTLGTSAGLNGTGAMSWFYGPALLTVTPSLGASRRDTSISHVQFVTPISKAKAVYGTSCSGLDPSDTRMGLAEWFRSALLAVDNGLITGLTFTKDFEVTANASARFGYTLVPVTNATDNGGGLSYDRTSRVSIALAPPHEGLPPPTAVYVVDEPEAVAKKRVAVEKSKTENAATSTREHAVHDQTLQSLLQRRAPIKFLP